MEEHNFLEETPQETPQEKPLETPRDMSMDEVVEETVATSLENSVDTPLETSLDSPLETSLDSPVDAPTEHSQETPLEKPKKAPLTPEEQQRRMEHRIMQMVHDLDKLEDDLSRELTILKRDIGEEFNGYAEAVMEIGQNLQQIAVACKRNDLATKINNAAIIAAIGMSLYGTYRQVSAHNEYLDKLLVVKQQMAKDRIRTMRSLIPRLERAQKTTQKMIMRFMCQEIPQDVVDDPEKLELRKNLGLRIFPLFGSACFFLLLANYIKAEAEAWQRGQHTSRTPLPGNSDVLEYLNSLITEATGKDLVDTFLEIANDNVETVAGRHLIVAADPQCLAFVLHNVKPLDMNLPTTPLAKILSENKMTGEYRYYVSDTAEYAEEHKTPGLSAFMPIFFSLLGLLPIWLLIEDSLAGQIILSIIYLTGIWTTYSDFRSRILDIWYYGLCGLIEHGEEAMKEAAGFVQQPSRDYEKKSFWKESLKQLLFTPAN